MMGKQIILACLLLSMDYATISRLKRNYILREQILEVVISKWQVIICTPEDCNLLPEETQCTGQLHRFGSEDRLGIDSNSHTF